MDDAHAMERCTPVLDDGCTSARRERGFSLVELLVVLAIIGIVMAVVLPNVRTASSGTQAPAVAVGGGTVWRAVQQWRLENGGALPAASLLTGKAAGLKDPAGAKMIGTWPEDARGAALPLTARQGTGNPPATGAANTLAYSAAADGSVGWLVGYGPTGSIVFQRQVTVGATPQAARG